MLLMAFKPNHPRYLEAHCYIYVVDKFLRNSQGKH